MGCFITDYSHQITRILAEHGRDITTSLAGTAQLTKAAFRLLATMSSFSETAALSVIREFDFSNPAIQDVNKRRLGTESDARSLFLRFVTALMHAISDAALKSLMLHDALWKVVFAGMGDDCAVVIAPFLRLLHTRLLTPSFTKSERIKFFKANVLVELASLYKVYRAHHTCCLSWYDRSLTRSLLVMTRSCCLSVRLSTT